MKRNEESIPIISKMKFKVKQLISKMGEISLVYLEKNSNTVNTKFDLNNRQLEDKV